MEGIIDIKVPTWLKIVAGVGVALIGVALMGDNDKETETENTSLSGIKRNEKGSILL